MAREILGASCRASGSWLSPSLLCVVLFSANGSGNCRVCVRWPQPLAAWLAWVQRRKCSGRCGSDLSLPTMPLLEGGRRIDGPIPKSGRPHGNWGRGTLVPVWRRKILGDRRKGRTSRRGDEGDRTGQARPGAPGGVAVGADQLHCQQYPGERKVSWLDRHRFPGDPVHPIPAQQGQQTHCSNHRMGRETKQLAPGLTGCCPR